MRTGNVPTIVSQREKIPPYSPILSMSFDQKVVSEYTSNTIHAHSPPSNRSKFTRSKPFHIDSPLRAFQNGTCILLLRSRPGVCRNQEKQLTVADDRPQIHSLSLASHGPRAGSEDKGRIEDCWWNLPARKQCEGTEPGEGTRNWSWRI